MGSDASRWTYKPYLDGIRAIAVYLVVAFHAGIGRASGGFIGVDVFFVLSGYLVTTVLLRDLASGSRVRLARFYARRVRRLLPAACTTLVVTLVVYSAVAGEAALESAQRATKAAFLYVTNWFMIRESADYFAQDIDANPVMHFWSLAVEEQFYFAWPLVLSASFVIGRRLPGPSIRWVQAFVGVGVVASAGLAFAWRVDLADRAYFGTDTRAYQLLVGALLALAPGLVVRLGRKRIVADLLAGLSLLGLLVAASSWWSASAISRGILAALLTVGVLAGIEASPHGIVARAWGWRPAVYLGRISYGTYLWHWPVIVIMREVWSMSDRSQFFFAAVLASALAALSFELIEQPIRRWERLDRWPVPVAVAGLVVAVVAAAVVVPRLPDVDGAPRPVAAAATGSHDATFLTAVPDDFDFSETYFAFREDTVSCVDQEPEACTVHQGSGTHIAIMGDSIMHSISAGFVEMARRYDLTLTVGALAGCPWPRGFYVLTPMHQERCRIHKEDMYERVLPALRPDVLVLLDSTPRSDWRDVYRSAVIDSIPQLAELTDAVVLIEALPRADPDVNPLECLRTARYAEQCRFEAETEPTWHDLLYREASSGRTEVSTLDLDRFGCPTLPTCEAMVDGRPVWWDHQHITAEFAATWADPLYRELAAIGVVPPIG